MSLIRVESIGHHDLLNRSNPLCVRAKSLQSCPTLWTVTCQAPLSMGFSRQEILELVASRGSSPPRD